MSKETIEMGTLEKGAEDAEKKQLDIPKPSNCCGIRHIQILLMFFLTFLAYGIRANLSVGIVAMTTPASPNPDIPIFDDWHDKSIVLSSFFWGYVIPQIAAGQVAKKWGAKWFLVGTTAVGSLFSIILPKSAQIFGSKGVMISRALQGFCQGFIFPSIHTILSHWVPVSERSRLGTFVYAGGPLGTVVSMIVTGIISASWQGWPLVFYVYGVAGLIWSVAMGIFGYDQPSDCPTISKEEKQFIDAGIGRSEKNIPTPWRKIWTSLPVWAIIIAHCGQNWGFWTMLTEIPSYMNHVMNFQIKSNSYLSALPYFVLWLLSFVFSGVADLFINKQLFSIGTTRKIFTSIGLLLPAAALVFLGYMNEEHQILAVTLLVIIVGLNSAIYSGYNVNHMDVSPNHSGILMGISNCLSNICSLIAPLVVQFIVDDEKNPGQWQVVFIITSSVYVATNLFFTIYGSGEIQSWNDEEDTSKE